MELWLCTRMYPLRISVVLPGIVARKGWCRGFTQYISVSSVSIVTRLRAGRPEVRF
jgi:hypothetical protein